MADDAPTLRVHIVRKGDTLASLSKLYLGDANRANEIKEKNDMANDCIREDEELIIPDR